MILKEKKKESTDDLPLMPVDWDISRQDDSVPVRWLNKAMSLSVTFHRIHKLSPDSFMLCIYSAMS